MWDFLYALGRVCLPIVFIVSGWGKFMNVDSILNNPGVKTFMSTVAGGAAPPTALGYLIAAIEVFGGLMILVGFKARWAALGLVVFTLCTIFFRHHFWTFEGAARVAEQTQALKNLAIIGGLLMVAAIGSGRFSVDNRGSSA
jgi:putative oxidoreductase